MIQQLPCFLSRTRQDMHSVEVGETLASSLTRFAGHSCTIKSISMQQHCAICCCFRHAALSITHETHFLSVSPFLKARSSKCARVELGSMQRPRALLVYSSTRKCRSKCKSTTYCFGLLLWRKRVHVQVFSSFKFHICCPT